LVNHSNENARVSVILKQALIPVNKESKKVEAATGSTRAALSQLQNESDLKKKIHISSNEKIDIN